MNKLIGLVVLFSSITTAAQQNWAAVPCFSIKPTDGIGKMIIDPNQNELILNTFYSSQICTSTYKGFFAFDGAGFHDLDIGINTHNPNPAFNSVLLNDCISHGNKTLYGGAFLSVGSNTLLAKSLAIWNGGTWESFPTAVFNNTTNWNSDGVICGFLNYDNKLWMYGGFDTIGTTVTKNLAVFNNNTFTAVPDLPANQNPYISKMVVYKNKLIATGNFYDDPSFDYFRLAQFDGTNWSQMGTGIRGSLSACQDLLVYNDTLFIAGAFPKSAGNAGNYVMKWDGTQLLDAGFGDFCGYGTIWKLLNFRNRLYAFGAFECAAGQKAFGMAYYEGGKWTVSQDSAANRNILSAAIYKDAIYIGGGFSSINGDTTLRKFAKLLCPDFDAASGCLSGIKKTSQDLTVSVFPNPATSKVTIRVANDQQIERLTLLNALGQQLLQQDFSQPHEELDISALPPGIYFLKISTRHGAGATKLVKQ